MKSRSPSEKPPSRMPSDSRGANAETAGWVQAYLDERGRRIVDALAIAADGLGASPTEVSMLAEPTLGSHG